MKLPLSDLNNESLINLFIIEERMSSAQQQQNYGKERNKQSIVCLMQSNRCCECFSNLMMLLIADVWCFLHCFEYDTKLIIKMLSSYIRYFVGAKAGEKRGSSGKWNYSGENLMLADWNPTTEGTYRNFYHTIQFPSAASYSIRGIRRRISRRWMHTQCCTMRTILTFPSNLYCCVGRWLRSTIFSYGDANK